MNHVVVPSFSLQPNSAQYLVVGQQNEGLRSEKPNPFLFLLFSFSSQFQPPDPGRKGSDALSEDRDLLALSTIAAKEVRDGGRETPS